MNPAFQPATPTKLNKYAKRQKMGNIAGQAAGYVVGQGMSSLELPLAGPAGELANKGVNRLVSGAAPKPLSDKGGPVMGGHRVWNASHLIRSSLSLSFVFFSALLFSCASISFLTSGTLFSPFFSCASLTISRSLSLSFLSGALFFVLSFLVPVLVFLTSWQGEGALLFTP